MLDLVSFAVPTIGFFAALYLLRASRKQFQESLKVLEEIAIELKITRDFLHSKGYEVELSEVVSKKCIPEE